MTTTTPAQVRTRAFARVLGPFFTIVPTTVAVRGCYMRELFTEFTANPMPPRRSGWCSAASRWRAFT